MNEKMLESMQRLKKRFEQIEQKMSSLDVVKHIDHYQKLAKEHSDLAQKIEPYQKWLLLKKQKEEAMQLLDNTELGSLAKEELIEIESQEQELENLIQRSLLPNDKEEKRNAFLEIRAGTGGDEASIFAEDLFRMYARYCERQRWKIENISFSKTDKGYREVILKVIGDHAYGNLRFESGGHRVQRVPVTESQGRIHTSTCIVTVLPEVPEEEIPMIQPSDLRIDTFRSSGAGGQHVNTTDSAIRITHIPSGIVVECQDERSQHKNKAKAMSVLAARLKALQVRQQKEQEEEMRRSILASGERSDRIRTYNFPQGRVTDHRINLTVYQLSDVLDGNLTLFIDPLKEVHYQERIASIK